MDSKTLATQSLENLTLCATEAMQNVTTENHGDQDITSAPSSSNSNYATASMDPEIWSNLPDHLLDHVLSSLPFWCILQLKCVSKRWRENLNSTNFITKWYENSPADVLFLMYPRSWHMKKSVAAYNPCLNKWHLIPLSFIHPKSVSRSFEVMASFDSLLCYEESEWPERSLIVSNLINKTYRIIPPLLDMNSPYVVGMSVDPDRRGYKIIVANDGESLVSQCYNSKTNSWKMDCTMNRKVAIVVGMVSLGGLLYCLSFWPIGLIAYNMEQGSWQDVDIILPDCIVFPHVIEYNEELVLIAGLEECRQLTSIRIWKLDLLNKCCIQVEQMPDHIFQNFIKLEDAHFACTGESGLICFNDGITHQMFMYSMMDNRWWEVPPCPLLDCYTDSEIRYILKVLGFPIKPCFLIRA